MIEKKFGSFPDDYMVGDTETSGVVVAQDLVLQVGYCLVEGGKAVETKAVLLNWPDSGLVPEDWLRDRLAQTKQHVEFDKFGNRTNKNYKFTYEMLRQGLPPRGVLTEYHGLLMDCRAAGQSLVFHNGYNFDGKILKSHFQHWLGIDWEFNDNELWDTGMLEKASQCNFVPEPRDSWKSYAARVSAARLKGVFWSLDGHCIPKYGLEEKHKLDASQAHDAGYDCYLAHLVLEEYKEILRREDQVSAATAGPTQTRQSR